MPGSVGGRRETTRSLVALGRRGKAASTSPQSRPCSFDRSIFPSRLTLPPASSACSCISRDDNIASGRLSTHVSSSSLHPHPPSCGVSTRASPLARFRGGLRIHKFNFSRHGQHVRSKEARKGKHTADLMPPALKQADNATGTAKSTATLPTHSAVEKLHPACAPARCLS